MDNVKEQPKVEMFRRSDAIVLDIEGVNDQIVISLKEINQLEDLDKRSRVKDNWEKEFHEVLKKAINNGRVLVVDEALLKSFIRSLLLSKQVEVLKEAKAEGREEAFEMMKQVLDSMGIGEESSKLRDYKNKVKHA